MIADPVSSPRLPSARGLRSKMTMKHCRELFAEFPIDPESARRAVPASYVVRIHPNGMALLLLMIQECDSCVLDQLLLIRPMNMAHFWIELAGPEEVGPALPGTTASLPTSYYYVLPHQIDSPLASLALRSVGIDIQRVASISIGGEPGVLREGHILESRSSGCGCSLEEYTPLWSTPQLLTGRRWFFRDCGRNIQRRSVGLVECNSTFLGDGKVTLTANEGSILDRYGLGTILHGTSQAVEMSCEANIWVGPRSAL
jgi:hypothetical protein